MRQSMALLLLVVAVVATLTHVCVLPVHDAMEVIPVLHAETAWARGSHHELAGPATRPTDAHLAHASACSATTSTAVPSAVPPLVAAVSAPDTTEPVRVAIVTAAGLDGSPPLFLLHAALLI